MAITQKPPESIDHLFEDLSATDAPPDAPATKARLWRESMMVAVALVAVFALLAIVIAIVALTEGGRDSPAYAGATPAAAPDGAIAPAPKADDPAAKGVAFEKFEWVDPTLPPVPAGAVKKFEVDVYHHVTKVADGLAPTEVWSFSVNGKEYRGTGVSAPMVVTEGDTVDFTLTNGSSEKMAVNLPHSMDFHSAEVNPGTRYIDLAPGKSQRYRFVAKHPGVYMYHCATQPVLHHTGNGMVGMMVVKPKNLAPVDRELWTVQQEYYIGKPGAVGDLAKMQAKAPDVIAFNGYAEQYKTKPISVRKGEKIRMYVLNAGPSIWSAFHVIGTVFDKAHTDNGVARDVQTVNLAPSQGGWVEFTLDEEGGYPFVTHAFGDAVKGAIGVLQTKNAPKGAGHDTGGAPAGGAAGHGTKAATTADVKVTLGDMWIKADKTSAKAGKVTFAVKNDGATMHGMAMALTPVKADGGMLEESQLLGKGKSLAAGESEVITADLKPGRYELVCFVPGHYAAGQKLAFDVK
ncbi:MAG: cupredoxin domain-containing protein [Thermoleophilia bacterium]